jgi:hypothetical protein
MNRPQASKVVASTGHPHKNGRMAHIYLMATFTSLSFVFTIDAQIAN